MTFPGFFVAGVLSAAGYPQTKGFLTKREIVHAGMIDAVFIQLVKASACLGAKRPVKAARLLTTLFDPPQWNHQETHQILEDADPHLEVTGMTPRSLWLKLAHPMSVGDTASIKTTDEVPWSALGESSMARIYTGSFATALVWGLRHPEDAINALESDNDAVHGTVGLLASHGISLTAAQHIDEIRDNIETLIEAYEMNYELPDVTPPSLHSALGINDA